MKRSKALIKSIRLVDWCLIIIMSLLLLQSIYNLFAIEVVNSEENIIDVVIRTAAASIFGYFMSANFMSGKSEAVFQPFRQNPTQSVAKPTFGESSVQNTIGFTANPKPSDKMPLLQYRFMYYGKQVKMWMKILESALFTAQKTVSCPFI